MNDPKEIIVTSVPGESELWCAEYGEWSASARDQELAIRRLLERLDVEGVLDLSVLQSIPSVQYL